MKLWKIFTGVFLILFASFGLLDATGIISPIESAIGEITLTQIIVGLAVILSIIYSIIKSKIPSIVLLMTILFMIFERNIAVVFGLENHNIINNWLLALFALLLFIGVLLVIPKKPFWYKAANHVSKGHRIGSNSVYIDSATFTDRNIENNMSSTVVKFENVDAYIGDGILHIENNMGTTVIYVPSDWKLDINIENNLGNVSNHVGAGGNGPCLKITGENNMGSIVLQKN